jgi:tRNA(fMet)-specific endonuclease VapC
MPKAGEVILDSNALIAFLADDPAFISRFGSVQTLLPVIVLGELYYGAFKSRRVQANLTRLDNLVTSSAILVCDDGTARLYGMVKQRLKAKGRAIPENDMWISAIALQHGLPLATRDAHFLQVDDLMTESW